MLEEIRIGQLGVIESSTLRLGPGLTVTTIVLPAPVSPVITVRPGPSSSREDSMTPSWPIRISSSISRSGPRVAAGARPDHPAVGAPAEEQPQRGHHHGLAGPGLAGDDGEPRPELEP